MENGHQIWMLESENLFTGHSERKLTKYRLGSVAVQEVTWNKRCIECAIILSFIKG
jgi:hypothetical protein